VCDNNDGKKEERLRINRKKKLVEYCHKLNQSKSFPKVQELSTIQSILAKHFEKRKLLHHFFNLSSSRRIAKLRLNLITLKSMSIPKLQILVNDFHTQIESKPLKPLSTFFLPLMSPFLTLLLFQS